MRHVHNLHITMERRVQEIFAGLGAALSVAPALPTEMPPDRWRKFVVIEGGKSVIRAGREARSVASAGMKAKWRGGPGNESLSNCFGSGWRCWQWQSLPGS
jgi:hypothetical protein